MPPRRKSRKKKGKPVNWAKVAKVAAAIGALGAMGGAAHQVKQKRHATAHKATGSWYTQKGRPVVVRRPAPIKELPPPIVTGK